MNDELADRRIARKVRAEAERHLRHEHSKPLEETIRGVWETYWGACGRRLRRSGPARSS